MATPKPISTALRSAGSSSGSWMTRSPPTASTKLFSSVASVLPLRPVRKSERPPVPSRSASSDSASSHVMGSKPSPPARSGVATRSGL